MQADSGCRAGSGSREPEGRSHGRLFTSCVLGSALSSWHPLHFTGFGVSGCSVLLSRPDRLSTWDRRSPISAFSFSDRVSIPDRLSLVVRLSLAERFSWPPIVCLRRLPRIIVDGAYYQWLQAQTLQS